MADGSIFIRTTVLYIDIEHNYINLCVKNWTYTAGPYNQQAGSGQTKYICILQYLAIINYEYTSIIHMFVYTDQHTYQKQSKF